MPVAGFDKLLRAARKLPLDARSLLIETLLNETKPTRRDATKHKTSGAALEALSGMNQGELQTLADAILAPGRQRRLRQLLRKNKAGRLSRLENNELDELLEESDRIALLKAKAQYTLQLSQNKAGTNV